MHAIAPSGAVLQVLGQIGIEARTLRRIVRYVNTPINTHQGQIKRRYTQRQRQRCQTTTLTFHGDWIQMFNGGHMRLAGWWRTHSCPIGRERSGGDESRDDYSWYIQGREQCLSVVCPSMGNHELVTDVSDMADPSRLVTHRERHQHKHKQNPATTH
jgi:hypothetical protein